MIRHSTISHVVMERCGHLLTALSVYEVFVRELDGVDLAVAINGVDRASLAHRDGMPDDWAGYFGTTLGLCRGEIHLLQNVADILSGTKLEAAQPSFEAMLCVAEDLIIIAQAYPDPDDDLCFEDGTPEMNLVSYAMMVAKTGGISADDLDHLTSAPEVVDVNSWCAAIERLAAARLNISSEVRQ